MNNVLGFPYIFRGALDVRATRINQEMQIAAVHAIAGLTHEETPVKDGLKRYTFTPDGISPRWIPGNDLPPYNANGDEHDEIGDVNEEAQNAKLIFEKRMKKLIKIENILPEPLVYGEPEADITFVGWGSVKSTILDCINILKGNNTKIRINYVHFEYLYPLKTELLLKTLQNSKRAVLIENNFTGQLGELIASKTGHKFTEKLLKYDGRPFFIEDVLNFILEKNP